MAHINDIKIQQQFVVSREMASKRTTRRQLSFGEVSDSVAERTNNGVCELCHGISGNMSSPSNWRSEPARTLVASLNIDFTRQVCPKCRKDVTRCLADDTYIPQWEKPNRKSTCSVIECTDAILASLGKPKELMEDALRRAKLEVTEAQTPIPLCRRHYHDLVQPSKQVYCTTCWTTLRVTNHRKCSNPKKIEAYLREHTDFDGHILENDKVCHTCYKSHLIILQTSNYQSTDADLEQLINDLSKQLSNFRVGSEKDAADKAMSYWGSKTAFRK